MSDQLRESLSAVLDGEADEFELRRVLDEIRRDDSLAEQWRNFELIGSVLREEQQASLSLRHSVMSAIDAIEAGDPGAGVDAASDDEDVFLQAVAGAGGQPSVNTSTTAAPRSRFKPVFGPVLGMGVAAAVAFAVVVGVNSGAPGVTQPGADVQLAEQLTSPTATPGDAAVVLATDTTELDTQRARAYLMHHVQQTAMNRGRVVSFARLASVEQTPMAVGTGQAPQRDNQAAEAAGAGRR